ncbi:MAG: hypothetical protein IJF41_05060 [Clostridia bacterium]|nr:hypothetical protein [Clostridia bacterium]
MPILLLLDPPNGRVRSYALDPDDQLPRVLHLGCSLRDYCGGTVPEVLWADLRLLRALDRLADQGALLFSVRSGFSLSRSFPSACGERLTIAPQGLSSLPPSFVHAALSSGFTGVSTPWQRGYLMDLYCSAQPWVLKPGAIGCQVCFLQWALRSLGFPLSITGVMDAPTLSTLRSFQKQFGYQEAALADQPFLKSLFQLTRPPRNATIQISYGFGGKEHGL